MRRTTEMRSPGKHHGINGYVRARMLELALPETRAYAEPLASWAQRRIRLDGKPFTFEGHEYLRSLYSPASSSFPHQRQLHFPIGLTIDLLAG
jgi:hypothetical protein